jgi:nucleotide-binding universal stress UspA family protein
MTYATLMVHLELGRSNAGLLKIAGDLAVRFRAGVIGIAACQPIRIGYGDAYLSGDVIEQDREEIEKEIHAAEAEFRAALQPRSIALEWRSATTFELLSDYLANEARNADLIITGVDRNDSLFDTSRHVNMGDFVMRAGRPVLIVPTGAEKIGLDRVLVGWKDTREARRAIFDAVPLLRKATQVTVIEIVDEDNSKIVREQLKDVAGWLDRHGIVAETAVSVSSGGDASLLRDVARQRGADLIVAGAYGHSRLREWVFGGVTYDLLLCSDIP